MEPVGGWGKETEAETEAETETEGRALVVAAEVDSDGGGGMLDLEAEGSLIRRGVDVTQEGRRVDSLRLPWRGMRRRKKVKRKDAAPQMEAHGGVGFGLKLKLKCLTPLHFFISSFFSTVL
jgi:hypothetical protein